VAYVYAWHREREGGGEAPDIASLNVHSQEREGGPRCPVESTEQKEKRRGRTERFASEERRSKKRKEALNVSHGEDGKKGKEGTSGLISNQGKKKRGEKESKR